VKRVQFKIRILATKNFKGSRHGTYKKGRSYTLKRKGFASNVARVKKHHFKKFKILSIKRTR
jgi:hypothetical protein